MSLKSRQRSLLIVVGLLLYQSSGGTARTEQRERGGRSIEDPARIVFQHDGQNISGFALYLLPDNGSPIRIDLGLLKPDANGNVSASLPPLPAGSYRVEIAAYNAAGESSRAPADPPSIIVTPTSPEPAAAPSPGHH